MQARMKNPAMVVPDALEALIALGTAVKQSSIPRETQDIVHLRASQINGCSFCVDMARKAAAADPRLFSVAAWRETPYFTDAERAALALTESVTRLSDRADPVPDDVWEEAAHHYDEPTLGALVLLIATVNLWNRVNAATKQIAGSWPG